MMRRWAPALPCLLAGLLHVAHAVQYFGASGVGPLCPSAALTPTGAAEFDDTPSVPVQLPFSFPFFDELTNTVYVSPNGGVTMGRKVRTGEATAPDPLTSLLPPRSRPADLTLREACRTPRHLPIARSPTPIST